MVSSIHAGRRKIDPSSRPQYQNFIDGDSIYTCSKFTSEREPQVGDSIFRLSKKFKKSLLVEHGPWFLGLGPVLERRDQSRHRLWKRQKNKRLKRISSATRPTLPQADPQQANSQQADEEEADRTITVATFGAQETSSPPVQNMMEASSRAATPDLPSSDLLRSIHHEAAILYSSHDVFSIPTPHRGPRPKNWEEPIAMARALDGSALMAIGVLLEEITKDQIDSRL